MAQLSAVITTSDPDFRSTITTLLRSSGLSIGLIDEKHAGSTWPDLAVVDIRSGTTDVYRGHRAPSRIVALDVDLRRRGIGRARSDPSGDARRRQRVPGVAARRARHRAERTVSNGAEAHRRSQSPEQGQRAVGRHAFLLRRRRAERARRRSPSTAPSTSPGCRSGRR